MLETEHLALREEKSWIVLESLLCLLRERNILTRGDIEELCARVERRASTLEDPLPCCKQSASTAATELAKLSRYIGQRYGGRRKF